MKVIMSAALRLDLSQHRLVCCCEDCDHFLADATERGAPLAGACALLFPTAPHRRATWQAAADGDELSFCKLFEAHREEAVGGGPMARQASAEGGDRSDEAPPAHEI